MVALSISTLCPCERWLQQEAAAVLFASKAGELVNIDYRAQHWSPEQISKALESLFGRWGVSSTLLFSDTWSEKWLLHFPERVSRALSQVPDNLLSRRLGYPCQLQGSEFIEEVAFRWKESGRIPHEVGIALGYPPKDVLAYMGLLDLEERLACGWRVYGDPRVSLDLSKEYTEARQLIQRMSASQLAQ